MSAQDVMLENKIYALEQKLKSANSEIERLRREKQLAMELFDQALKEVERLRAVIQKQVTWLRERGAQLDEYVTTQHDYYKHADILERALKGEK